MHFGRGFLNKPLKMNKEKSSNVFFVKEYLLPNSLKLYVGLMLFGRNWPEASLNMVMRNIQDVMISQSYHSKHI